MIIISSETIIFLGKLAAAVLSIYAVVKLLGVPISKCIKMLLKIKQHNDENYINILQLKIMAPYMPLEERVAAGYTYTKVLHQNGPVHLEYELLQEEYKKKHGKKYTNTTKE